MLIIRRAKLYYTVSGIITPIGGGPVHRLSTGRPPIDVIAALEGGECSAARPGRTLPPGKTRYPLHRRLVGPQGRSGRA